MFQSYFPEQTLGPAPHVPNRNITFPKTDMANWKDVVPRMGASYDVFGNGRTAVKVSLNKYVTAQGLQGTYGDTANPVNRLANVVTRTWTDADRDFVADCDLTNVLAQDLRASGGDFCGVVSDTNFGKPTLSLNYDPETLNGWGTRPFQWEFSTSVQHQIVPSMSVDVGYFRRWYGNFGVTDNLTLSPVGFRHLRHRDSGRPAAAGRRRLGLRFQGRQSGQGGTGAEQLLHAGAELRQADRTLERRGPDLERADPGGHDGTGRHQHRSPGG